jgi:hypothetical protein
MDAHVSEECLGASITASLHFVGEDCVAVVSGGVPHIGSISVGLPRVSRSGMKAASATVSTFNLIGHMNDAVGNEFAHALASLLGQTVVVVCGIHYDEASADDIEEIKRVSEKLLNHLIEECKATLN